jgi:transcriptional regulator with XRE-family HTH domain
MVHIGKKIRDEFEKSGMTVTEFARRIKTTRQNVYGIFERFSIDTALLERIGKALNYDFFKHYINKTTKGELALAAIREHKLRMVLRIETKDPKKTEVVRELMSEAVLEQDEEGER